MRAWHTVVRIVIRRTAQEVRCSGQADLGYRIVLRVMSRTERVQEQQWLHVKEFGVLVLADRSLVVLVAE